MRGNLFLRDWEVPKWTYVISKDLEKAMRTPGEPVDYAAKDITPNQMISILEELDYIIDYQEGYNGQVHIILFSYEKPNIWISDNALDMTFKLGVCEEEE